jgi:predicted acylesterase/phospholipase RssA
MNKGGFAMAALAAVANAADSCHALALNGGGSKGAYQAGVIWGFAHYGDPEQFQWDVVSGISAGAINTGALSIFDKSNVVEMADFVADQWKNLTTKKVWNFWPGGIKEGLTTAPSLVDSTPLKTFLQGVFE